MIRSTELEHLLRPLAPEVLGLLVRRHGRFGACEDAVQEALLAAAVQWPEQGVPENPRAWLLTVASRRLIDELRGEVARRRREELTAETEAPAAAAGLEPAPTHDDTPALLFLCCHQSLTASSQIALTLRAVGGLTTAEIASAFLVPEATMAQRISRAKATIKASGTTFELPSDAAGDPRLGSVLHVLYLIFNEGYASSSGTRIQRVGLAEEAIRLTRTLQRLLPGEDELRGLLALMLLTHARRGARTTPGGALIPLAEQDRARWDHAAIAEGVGLITGALSAGMVGPFQLQAAIAAVHAEAPSAAETDWREITVLYELLERIAPNPVFTLNRAVAVAMLRGPGPALALLAEVERDQRLAGSHRVGAVRGHLLELAGDTEAAAAAYEIAARLTTSLPERQYLQRRAAAARIGDAPAVGPKPPAGPAPDERWPPTPWLSTERLSLEPLRVGHAAEMVPLLDDPQLHAFTGGRPATPAELRDRYRRQSAGHSPDGAERWLNWIVRLREPSAPKGTDAPGTDAPSSPGGEHPGGVGHALGSVQATISAGGGSSVAQLAWLIASEHQGRGYAREAAEAMAAWLRERGVQRLVALIHPRHQASAQVARALGLLPSDQVVDGEIRWTNEPPRSLAET